MTIATILVAVIIVALTAAAVAVHPASVFGYLTVAGSVLVVLWIWHRVRS